MDIIKYKMITLNKIQPKHSKTTGKKAFPSTPDTVGYAKKQVNNSFCSGQILIHKLEDIAIYRLVLKIKEQRSVRINLPKDCLHVYFLFNGQLCIQLPSHHEFLLQSDTHNVFYTPPGICKIKISPAPCDLFYVRLPLCIFKQYVHQNKRNPYPFFKKTKSYQSLLLKSNQSLNNPRAYRIIDEICTEKKHRELHALFIKAKIIELLSVQMEQLHNCNPPPHFSNKEIAQKMLALRSFLIENMGEYYSLKELASQVGTNEFTLKKEFKRIFGETVFGFWREIKMEKAQELLSKNKIPIKEISEIVGYKNPQHFSTAFKKNFGMSPSAFKNMSI